MADLDKVAVQNFQEYLKIKSVPPNPDYEECIKWLRMQGKELDLEFNIVRFPEPAEFTAWLTWKGSNTELKSIMLNSHMDVVPVDMENWTKDPFGGEITENGNIYGRGSQDMKSVGVQYLEAIRRLKKNGYKPVRTIHVTFVPDEELGGKKGMAEFVKSKEFLEMNVGVELDEGGVSPIDTFLLFYGERTRWEVEFTITGNTGHALMFIENTVAEKLQKVLSKMLAFRESEKKRLLDGFPKITLGDVTTLNMTMIQGGIQGNVLPPKMTVTFDMRITPHWGLTAARKFIDDVCKESGPGVTYELVSKGIALPTPKIEENNIWWKEFQAICDTLKIKVLPTICPGATDARYVREQGIAAFGFTPANLTPILAHDNDEYLNKKIFLRGIEIYEAIIQRFASFSGSIPCLGTIGRSNTI